MNAQTSIRRWDHASHVASCTTCEGKGEVWNGKGLGGNDPDSWNVECPDCNGAGHFACKVCGFDLVIAGFDCFACDVTHDIPASMLTADTAAQIGTAMAAAFEARVKAGLVL